MESAFSCTAMIYTKQSEHYIFVGPKNDAIVHGEHHRLYNNGVHNAELTEKFNFAPRT